tara:strand:- start:318 stop:614 length:297 start_codon:yes stop_codon:yes gene_type:complete
MVNQKFKDEYIDKDDYSFFDNIDKKKSKIFRTILVFMLIIYLYATYVVVNKVFLVPRERREPKLLFVILILIFTVLYFIYHEIALFCTKFIINNTYPI